jgi:hypothetical protein
MRPIVGAAFVLALALPVLGDEDKAKDKAASTEGTTRAGGQYQALLQEYQEAMAGLLKTYREAKTPADRQRVIQEARALPDRFAPRFLALATKNPKDPASVDALTWVLQNSRAGGRSAPRTKAVALLRRTHLKSDKLGPACQALASATDRDSENLLRSVLSTNPHKDVQGAACLSLAELLSQRAEAMPAETAPKVQRDSEKLFERAVRDYGNVRLATGGTVGDTAKKELFVLQHLAIGKTAPDIAGEDQDGKKFKLSDYRGKVVMLDFWGNW